MATKRAPDQEEKQEKEALTPERRIEKLEGARKLNLILISVLGFICLLLLAAVITLFILSDPRPDRNAAALYQLQSQVEAIQDNSKTIEGFKLEAEVLNDKLDRVLNETDLNNFSALRSLMEQREEDHTRFIKALQQGMYDLSRMLRGSRTWYEVYKEDLDQVLQNSRDRLLQLQGMTAESDGKK